VLDKGTLDAMLCADADGPVTAMVTELFRILRPGPLLPSLRTTACRTMHGNCLEFAVCANLPD
jgi:hypothetical protein